MNTISYKTLFLCFFLLSTTVAQARCPANFKSCFESVMELMEVDNFNGAGAARFSNASDLAELEGRYGNESLFSIQQRLSNKEIKDQNKNLKRLLKRGDGPVESNGRIPHVTESQAQKLYRAMEDANVYQNEHCYARPDVTIGYCFGRAVVAHTEAILRGVDAAAVKKIWVVGDMNHWGHHVATIVRSKDGGWLAIDNVSGLVPADRWVDSLRRMQNGNKEVMFFVTQGERIGPYDARTYNLVDFFNTTTARYNREQDYYRGYFHDYFDWLDSREAVTPFSAQ